MQFKDVIQGAKDKAAEAGGVATDKMNTMLDEYRKAVSIVETFGFEVGRFHVGMGVLPEISTSIKGSIENIQADELRSLVEQNEERKLVGAMLTALIAAKEFQARADLLTFSGVTVDVKLGLPPKVSFDLHENVAA